MKLPEFKCKKTMNKGYLAFIAGKSYSAYKEYSNGFYFYDEHGNEQMLNQFELNKYFDFNQDEYKVIRL